MGLSGSRGAADAVLIGGAGAEGHERRPKLSEMVRAKILDGIRSGRWKPGDRLPTEPEMMKAFGVSRAPIREAMQSLLLLGIVDISPRRGAFVRALPAQSVIDLAILSSMMTRDRPIDAVYDFRHGTEGAIAALAARRVTDVQREELRAIIAENAAAIEIGDLDEARRIDVRFHGTIAVACGNVIFQAVQAALGGLLVDLRQQTGPIVGATSFSLNEHRQIFEAIARRDPAAAREATEAHILNSKARYTALRRLKDGGTNGWTMS
jgi:GntR family transcriptional repressor for pyruvate dehydrogenase complex